MRGTFFRAAPNLHAFVIGIERLSIQLEPIDETVCRLHCVHFFHLCDEIEHVPTAVAVPEQFQQFLLSETRNCVGFVP